MERFDIRDARLISIIVIICFIFAIVINQAFQYLPPQSGRHEISVEAQEKINQINIAESKSADNKNISEDSQIKEEIVEEIKPVQEIKEEIMPLESINEKDLQSVDTIDNPLVEADNLFINKDYKAALEKYKEIADSTNETLVKTMCYEKIANINAILKHYGSALSYAQKAYNLMPSTSLEILLARLYYKTGEIDKATSRINRVLQRDFAYD